MPRSVAAISLGRALRLAPLSAGYTRQARYLGRVRNKLWLELTAAAYNLTRLVNIEAAAAWLNRADSASSIGSNAPDTALSLTVLPVNHCLACADSSAIANFGTCYPWLSRLLGAVR